MRFLLFLLLLPLSLTSFETHPVTPFPVVGYREEPYFDDSQKTDRKILIWYPVDPEVKGIPSQDPWDVFNVAIDASFAASQSKMPLVVISHGYTGSPHQLSWLIRGLVHSGFIVLGIQHRDLIDGKVHVNHWRRANDVSNIITKFSSSQMAKFADLNKIAIAGFSLGGTTALWIAGGRTTKLKSLVPGPDFASLEDFVKADEALPSLNKKMMAKDWRDKRVKAAFIMAPAWSWLFDEESLRKINIPTYLIAAANDNVLVTKNNAGFFARLIPKALYQAIPGKGSHYIFISVLSQESRKKADRNGQLQFLFEDDPTIDRSWIQSEVVEEAVNFFNSTLHP